jgi:hypothetical protein
MTLADRPLTLRDHRLQMVELVQRKIGEVRRQAADHPARDFEPMLERLFTWWGDLMGDVPPPPAIQPRPDSRTLAPPRPSARERLFAWWGELVGDVPPPPAIQPRADSRTLAPPRPSARVFPFRFRRGA